MKLLVISAICYVISAHAAFDDYDGIITVPREGEEYVFIRASKNLNGFRQGRSRDSQKPESLFEPSKYSHSKDTRKNELSTKAQEWAPLNDEPVVGTDVETRKQSETTEVKQDLPLTSFTLEDAVSLPIPGKDGQQTESENTVQKRHSLFDEQDEPKPVSAFKNQEVDTVPAASGPVSSRTVVKTGPNGKDYEYEYLYYYDDAEEESEEEYEEEPKQTTRITTTTTTTTTTARPKRVRGKTTTTFAPLDTDAPKISNSRGQLRVQESSAVNKPPITNLRDNSISRAIRPTADVSKAATGAKQIQVQREEESPVVSEDAPEAVEEKAQVEDDQESAALVEAPEEAAPLADHVLEKVEKETPEVHAKHEEVEDDGGSTEVDHEFVKESKAHEEDRVHEDEKESIPSDDQGDKPVVSKPVAEPVKIEPMIVHAEMMDESDFQGHAQHEEAEEELEQASEPTLKPFDLEKDIASPTSSTPDELSESLVTEAPELARFPVATRFPPRIQAAIEKNEAELEARLESEREIERTADERTTNLPPRIKAKLELQEEKATEQHEASAEHESEHKEVEEDENIAVEEAGAEWEVAVQRIKPEHDVAEVPKVEAEEVAQDVAVDPVDIEREAAVIATDLNQDTTEQTVVLSEQPADSAEPHNALDNETSEDKLKKIAEVSETLIQSNRINDARAINNLFVHSQVISGEKEEAVKENDIVEKPEAKNLSSQTRNRGGTRQRTEAPKVEETTTEAPASKEPTRKSGFDKPRIRTPPSFLKPKTAAPQADEAPKEQPTARPVSTTRPPTDSSRRPFGNRRVSTTTKAPASETPVLETENEENSIPAATVTEKPVRGRVRAGSINLEPKRRKPVIPEEEEKVTPPITVELKRQRPSIISGPGTPQRISPLDRRHKTSSTTTTTTTEATEPLNELEATEAPEDPVTNAEIEEEVVVTPARTPRTTTTTTTTTAPETEATTKGLLRRRPVNIAVSEKPKKVSTSPVIAERPSPLARRKSSTTTTTPEPEQEKQESQEEQAAPSPVAPKEQVEEEEAAEPAPETTTKPARLSILEKSKQRRLRTRANA